jgi:hypothetical protein
MRIPSHRGAAVCIGGAAAAMAVCGGVLNSGAAKIMSPGEAATTLAWAAAFSEAIKLSWLAGFRVCLHRRELLAAATLLGVGALLHGYTVIAVLGSSAVARDQVASERQGKIAHFRAEAAVAEAEARVASYAGVRPEAVIQQDIARLIETPDANWCKRPYGQAAQLKSELPGARKADETREDLKNAQASGRLASRLREGARGSVEDAARGGDQAKRLAWKSKAADRSSAGAPDQQEVAFVSGIGETGGRKGSSSGGLEAVSPCIRARRRHRARFFGKAAGGAPSSSPHIHDPHLIVARQAREALRCSCSGEASV